MLVVQVVGLVPTIRAWNARSMMLPPPGWLDQQGQLFSLVGSPSFICTTAMDCVQAHLDPSHWATNRTEAGAVRPVCAHKVLKRGKGSSNLFIPTTTNIEN